MSDIFIFAGEASGDTHGASLVQEIKKISPNRVINGVPGPKMRNLGVKSILRMEDFQVMGFTDVLLNFAGLYKKFYLVRDWILKNNPKVVVLIDYPGFNLRLAKALRKSGWKGKIIHYICPSVWAWGKKRIETLANNVDELLTIYPFEKGLFAHTSLPVHYIGNPVVEAIKKAELDPNWRKKVGFPEDSGTLIAIFPGSRRSEIEKNLPVQLQAMEEIKKEIPDAVFALSITSPKIQCIISPILFNSKIKVHLVPSTFNYELMNEASTAIAKSGTVTLELALFERPTTVIYGLTAFNRFVAKNIIRLKMPYYCIVNILKQGKVFPELIEKGFDADTIARETISLISNKKARDASIEGCRSVRDLLGPSSASQMAAQSVVRLCEIK